MPSNFQLPYFACTRYRAPDSISIGAMVFLGVCGQKRGLEKFAKHSVGIGLEKIRNESLQQNLTGDIIFVHIRYVFVKL